MAGLESLACIHAGHGPQVHERRAALSRIGFLTQGHWRVGSKSDIRRRSLFVTEPTHSAGERVGMYRDLLDEHLLLGAVLLVDLDGLDLGQGGQAVVAQELPKHRVEAVEMRGLVAEDEELGSVGGRPLIRHGDGPTGCVLQGGPNLVLKGASPDGFATLGVVGGRFGGGAGLHHEVGDQAVEWGEVVVAGGAESKKVLGAWLDGRARKWLLGLELQGGCAGDRLWVPLQVRT